MSSDNTRPKSKKTAAQKEREAATPAKRTLEELLKPANAYERAISEHVLSRHDATLEAAIVGHQRSVQKCLAYVAGMAQKKAKGAQCVVMSEEEVYGLAVHWFLDGDTPIETDVGAPVEPASQPAEAAPAPKPRAEKKPKKPKKAKTEKKDDSQLLFDFWDEAKTEKKEEP